jgi:hypothetical protein
MNDNLETAWVIPLINEEISKRREIIKDEDIRKLSISFELNRLYPYIACFSKNNDLLSQWRAYSDDGEGIAIGFNQEKFRIKNKIPVNTVVVKDSIGYSNCIYSIDEQKNMINEILDLFCELLNQNKTTELDFINIAMLLNKLSIICKNPCFTEEQECRIIHIPIIMSDKDNNTKIMQSISEINFIIKRKSISSYFIFDLKEIFNSDLIPEIILGPKNKMNIYELGTYLSMKNLQKTIIKRSNASYI